MSVGGFISRFQNKKRDFAEMETQEKMGMMLAQKKKNSNERELERYLEEDRQANIKSMLEGYRSRRRAEDRNMNVLKGKDVFKGHKSVLSEDKSVLNNGKDSFMKQGNMLSKGNILGRSGFIK